MKRKDILKKVHWLNSSTLAIIMLIIFILLFVIAYSGVLNQKEVVVKEEVASAVDSSTKTDELKQVEEIVSTKSDESNKSVEVAESPKPGSLASFFGTATRGIDEEWEKKSEYYKGEESYEKVRNKLLSEGWLLLERSEIAKVKPGKEPKDGDGKSVSCSHWHPVEHPQDILTGYCWKEQLVSRKITKKYKELRGDAYWIFNGKMVADFVYPNNKEFENKVRHISFYVCNECPGKPKNYLITQHDIILTIGGAKTAYLNRVLKLDRDSCRS